MTESTPLLANRAFMRPLTLSVCAIIFTSLCPAQTGLADGSATFLAKDFPTLWRQYGDRAKQQKADYVVAVDVSDSMIDFREVVIPSVCNFLEALPDGDYVSLVSFGAGAQIVGVPTELNPGTRNTLRQSLEGMKFDQRETDLGSMADLVLTELNRPGGSDLKFVFVFTDFDHFRKDRQKPNWDALKQRYEREQAGRGVEFYAMQLQLKANSGRDLPRIEEIFPSLQVIPVNPATLGGWFERRKAEILRDRLRHIVANAAKEQAPQLDARCETNQIVLGLVAGAANEILRGVRVESVDFSPLGAAGSVVPESMPLLLSPQDGIQKVIATSSVGPYFGKPVDPPSLSLKTSWLFSADEAEIARLGISLPPPPSAPAVAGQLDPPGKLSLRATGSSVDAFFDTQVDGLSLRLDSLQVPAGEGLLKLGPFPLEVGSGGWTKVADVPTSGWVSRSFSAGEAAGQAAFVSAAEPRAPGGEFRLPVEGWLAAGRFAWWQVVTAAALLLLAVLYLLFAYRPGRKFAGKVIFAPPGQEIVLRSVSGLTIAADSKDKLLARVVQQIPPKLRLSLGTAGSLMHPVSGQRFLRADNGEAELLYKTGRKEKTEKLKPRQRVLLPSNVREFQVKSGTWNAKWMRTSK
jgi:hypothetical protein